MALIFAVIVILVTTVMSLPPVIRIGEYSRLFIIIEVRTKCYHIYT